MKKSLKQMMEEQMNSSKKNEIPQEWEIKEEREYNDPHTWANHSYDEPKKSPTGLTRKTMAIAVSISAVLSVIGIVYNQVNYRQSDEYKLTQLIIQKVNLNREYNDITKTINSLNDKKARTLSGILSTQESIEKLESKLSIGK